MILHNEELVAYRIMWCNNVLKIQCPCFLDFFPMNLWDVSDRCGRFDHNDSTTEMLPAEMECGCASDFIWTFSFKKRMK